MKKKKVGQLIHYNQTVTWVLLRIVFRIYVHFEKNNPLAGIKLFIKPTFLH